MKTAILLTVSLANLALLAGQAVADKLPKGAQFLSHDEIMAIYAGKTAVWSKTNAAYFAPDKSVTGIADGVYFSGKLEPRGDSEVCMAVQGWDTKKHTSDGIIYTDCWKWAKVKGKLWTLYTKSFDNKKLDIATGWWSGEIKNFKRGDLASARHNKMKNAK